MPPLSPENDGRQTRVYLACPITIGDGSWNYYQSCRAQNILMRAGYAVLAPALSMMHPNARNISHRMWMQSDLPWVECSDLVVRLPGASIGADMEEQHAKKHGIPVWHVSLEDLEHHFCTCSNGDSRSERHAVGY